MSADVVLQPFKCAADVKKFLPKELPTLWLYAENDLFFGPSLAREMHAAFRRGGSAAELYLLPRVGSDGHQLFTLDAGIPHWAPAVDRFLATLGFRSG